MQGMLDSYMTAIARHDPSAVHYAAIVKFTENGALMTLGQGFWKTAGAMKWHVDAIDSDGNAAARQAVVQEGTELVSFLLRLRTQGTTIIEAETIVARKGRADPFAPQKLTRPSAVFAQRVGFEARATRGQLRAIADAYFTAVQTEGTPGYKPAPLAVDANRFENGEQTTNVPVFGLPAASASDQLAKGFFKGLAISKRRFPVIDTEAGIVLGIGLMTGPDLDGLLLAEFFKVSDAKIRQIQAVLVNHSKNGTTGWD
jgi:hypothetical protein